MKAAGGAIAEAIATEAAQRAAADTARLPKTRAERTQYRETSRYADVVQFLDSLQRLRGGMHVGSIGRTVEGREIPYVVASRPIVRTPAEARRLGRPVVYVQANIHAGEVEGKEALLALVRDLVVDQKANVLDSIVLLAVPIYNADGNEKVAPQSRNRTEQNGPELVGERPNAQRLDLNRDYVKAEAPETRASLAMFAEWDPELFVDLHTTDGSFHGYALTYSPSLNPAAPGGAWARDSLLPELRRRVRARDGFETFDYGNFALEYGADVNTDTAKQGWYTYDHRPRFGTNYYGLRGRVAVLSEAYSHDPFERRVRATYAFVRELLSLAAERGPALMAFAAERDRRSGWLAAEAAGAAGAVPAVPIRAELTRAPYSGEVVAEELAPDPDSVPDEPGVPRGLRRTGRFHARRMPVHDRFDPTLRRARPEGYALDAGQEEVVRLLRLHGVVVERLTGDARARVQAFVVDSAARSARPFQGHNEVRLAGRWRGGDRGEERLLPAGGFVVPAAQPLGVLAMYLLEPESDDGLAVWNVFDRWLRTGAEFPVLRVMEPVRAPRRAEP
ncbi:MAG TPA: M14 family metallopeptidase [Gemmatimonadaceae bacterium]|nr:M14 family metallopeptidase [Gemmatimonadaceae bacterium]